MIIYLFLPGMAMNMHGTQSGDEHAWQRGK